LVCLPSLPSCNSVAVVLGEAAMRTESVCGAGMGIYSVRGSAVGIQPSGGGGCCMTLPGLTGIGRMISGPSVFDSGDGVRRSWEGERIGMGVTSVGTGGGGACRAVSNVRTGGADPGRMLQTNGVCVGMSNRHGIRYDVLLRTAGCAPTGLGWIRTFSFSCFGPLLAVCLFAIVGIGGFI